jgi:hypothetical protein
MVLLDFLSIYTKLFASHFKCFSFWHSADAKPMPNDPVHAMPWQCMFALFLSLSLSLSLSLYDVMPKVETYNFIS